MDTIAPSITTVLGDTHTHTHTHTLHTATEADTKAGVVLSSKATPTDEGAFSVDEPSEGTVVPGNLTELEKAIREAGMHYVYIYSGTSLSL